MVVRNLVRDQNRELLPRSARRRRGCSSSSTMSSRPSRRLLILAATYAADPTHAVRDDPHEELRRVGGDDGDRRRCRRGQGGCARPGGLVASERTRRSRGAHADLARRAVREKDLVTGIFVSTSKKSSVLCLAGRASQRDSTVPEELKLDPAQLTKTSGDEYPFSELQGAVYAAPTAQAGRSCSSARHPACPCRAAVANKERVNIGADHWLLTAKERDPARRFFRRRGAVDRVRARPAGVGDRVRGGRPVGAAPGVHARAGGGADRRAPRDDGRARVGGARPRRRTGRRASSCRA